MVCLQEYMIMLKKMIILKRISNYDFANIPIEKVKRESIEDFLEDERNKSNSIIKKDFKL